jgi:hypothetical protein
MCSIPFGVFCTSGLKMTGGVGPPEAVADTRTRW